MKDVYARAMQLAVNYWRDECHLPASWLKVPVGIKVKYLDQTPVRIERMEKGVYRVFLDPSLAYTGMTWVKAEQDYWRPLALYRLKTLTKARQLASFARQHGLRYLTLTEASAGRQEIPVSYLTALTEGNIRFVWPRSGQWE